ncbi:hypothetical protein P154DRAFT_546207 [Amniculicola lignicola CBS 123094]|uniref:Uncharacterized protein n=1 Tax=Amniculicola lignicola CBS 123094 TaxID=1392246 RepID=A0A6A5WCS0_9PLEO|nr:hypothetical protein P154DRAFT_546207 [Amniculicola lignicola CBS 123094]
MANMMHPRSAVADLGGKHLNNHKLVPDAPIGVSKSDQRAPGEASPKAAKQDGAPGGGQSASGETTGEDDDEDSSASKEDNPDDEDDDADVVAPSRGFGKGKGKATGMRPTIHIEHVGDDDVHDDNNETSHETGLASEKLDTTILQTKKRTYSNLSSTSLLFGDDDADRTTFPRKKIARNLTNLGDHPLLTYTEAGDNAIEDSDEGDDNEDEDYSGVNLISDESDLEDIEQQEESYIIQEARATAPVVSHDARRFSLDSTASDNLFDFTTPLDQLPFISLGDIGFTAPPSPEPQVTRKYSDSSTKRVRFDDEVQVSEDSSSESSELDSALYPDIFIQQDRLPASLYQMIEDDNDSDNADYEEFNGFSPESGSEHSYWDFGQDEARNQTPHTQHPSDDSSEAGSSGYETDMGDTTDEYDSDFASDAQPRTPRQKSVLRRPSSAPGSKASSPKPFQRSSRPIPPGSIPPMRGIFIHEEPSEAIAITDKTSRLVTFYRPRTSITIHSTFGAFGAFSSNSSTANNSPRTSLAQLNASDSESIDVFATPFQNHADVMLTGIFGSAPPSNYLFNGSTIGPPEAFYPFISVGSNGDVFAEEDDGDYEDEEFEDDLNITDFMDFGSDIDATDVDQEDETDVPATPATSMVAAIGSTPAQPTPVEETPVRRRTTSDAMLEHFDRGVVTAFRDHQNRYRDIACLPHDPDLRASVSRPVRFGKSAELLMSPLRKRGSISKKNDSSPFSGVTKASGRLQSSVMNSRRGPKMGTFS